MTTNADDVMIDLAMMDLDSGWISDYSTHHLLLELDGARIFNLILWSY